MKNSKISSNKIVNNSLSDISPIILYNTANYKSSIQNSISDILTKFVKVLLEYMRFISEKIIMKNKLYFRFIFERGLETIIHVFSVILYYTKNLELTIYHTQKAYYFYIEFIEQISDDTVTFLQLSSRDAILFVYKKTIFDINNEYRKTIPDSTQDEKNILSTVDSYTYIYKNIALFIINNNGFNYENKVEYINMCCDSLEFISQTLNKNKIKTNYIGCVNLFVSILDDKKLEIIDYFKLLDEFVKKIINKKKIDEKIIKNKIYDSEIINFINENALNKIVEYIFSD